jgi:hypothetical protein
VSEREVIAWAEDLVADGKWSEPFDGSLFEAQKVLSSLGVATFAAPTMIPSESTEDALRRLGFED